MWNRIRDRYPNLCELLRQGAFPKQVEKAERICMAASAKPQRALYDAHKGKQFGKVNKLIYYTCSPLYPGMNEVRAGEMEADVSILVSAGLLHDKLAVAYKKKLLNDDQFVDVEYELAASAICVGLLDRGTMNLEAGLDGKLNNTDIAGQWQCRKSRFEVTVLHDSWLTGLDAESQKIIEKATIDAGYEVVVGQPRVPKEMAEQVRRLIEDLYVKHKADPEGDLKIEAFTYLRCQEDDDDQTDLSGVEYRCDQDGSLIRRITFVADRTHRLASPAAVSRSTMGQHEVEQLSNPAGVIPALKSEGVTHQKNPYSTAIWQKLKEKAEKQCETGAINVIVLGQPSPVNDLEVENALHGVAHVSVPYRDIPPRLFSKAWRREKWSALKAMFGFGEKKTSRPRESGEGILQRSITGPFRPVSELADLSPDRRAEIVDANRPFAKVSAVLMVRLDAGHAKAKVFRNPNATIPLTDSDVQALLAAAESRCNRTASGSPMDPLTADGASSVEEVE